MWGGGAVERDTIHNNINYKAMVMNNVTHHCLEEKKEGILD